MYRIATALAAALAATGAAQSQDTGPGVAAPPPILVAPVAPPAPPAPPAPAAKVAPNLRGASVYIYNFLDFRAQMFGRRMLEQIDSQLSARLSDSGVRNERLMFRNSPAALTYAQTNVVGRSYDRIPVPETVHANLGRESAFGAQYRLIVIPANFEQTGAWQNYDIRWILMDVASEAILWSFVTSNRRMVLWRNDENSERRGRALMDQVMGDLRAQNLL